MSAFSALSQPTRLDTVRLLVRAGDEGLPAGEVAAQLGVRHNLMSNHFRVLTHAGLIDSERQGRSIIYRARYSALRALLSFLMTDCCSGVPEIVDGLNNGTEACEDSCASALVIG